MAGLPRSLEQPAVKLAQRVPAGLGSGGREVAPSARKNQLRTEPLSRPRPHTPDLLTHAILAIVPYRSLVPGGPARELESGFVHSSGPSARTAYRGWR